MDPVDEQVVRCLVADGRATYAAIGARVGLSASAVHRRVDRLLATGVLRGFTARVDGAALGWGTEAYLEVWCRGTVPPADLRRVLAGMPEVVDACTVSGTADALVHLRAADVAHLERTIERIRDDPRVERTESTVVLARIVDRAPSPGERDGVGRGA